MLTLKDIIKILTWIIPSFLILVIGCCHSNTNEVVTESLECPNKCQRQPKKGSAVAREGNARFGIDVSHHNGDIDWAKLRSVEELLFVYVKATEGATHVDKNFKANTKGAAEAGYLIGSYHFFRMTSSAHAQFENFCRAIGSVRKQDLIPMVDVETADKHSVAELQDSLKVFMQLVKNHYGVFPMIYGTNRSYNAYCAPDFNKYHLYIGRYGDKAPIVKGSGTYTIWQYSQQGELPGIPKPVDLAKFHPYHSIEEIKMPSILRF